MKKALLPLILALILPALAQAQEQKEKDCDLLQLEWWQGSGATAATLGCLITKTETRTNELKERYAVE